MPPILPALAPRKGVTNIGALQGNFTPQAFTSGYHWAFAALAAFAAIGAVVAFEDLVALRDEILPRRKAGRGHRTQGERHLVPHFQPTRDPQALLEMRSRVVRPPGLVLGVADRPLDQGLDASDGRLCSRFAALVREGERLLVTALEHEALRLARLRLDLESLRRQLLEDGEGVVEHGVRFVETARAPRRPCKVGQRRARAEGPPRRA